METGGDEEPKAARRQCVELVYSVEGEVPGAVGPGDGEETVKVGKWRGRAKGLWVFVTENPAIRSLYVTNPDVRERG